MENTLTTERSLYAGLRGLKLGTYQSGDFDQYLDFLDSSGFGLADGLQPYVDHLTETGWTDRNRQHHDYKAASIRAKADAARRLGDYVMEHHADTIDAASQLTWERMKKKVNLPKPEKAIDESKYLTWADVQTLIQKTTDIRLKLVIAFLAQSACRVSEALNVKLDHMTRNGTHYRIRVTGKGGKERTVAVRIPVIERILDVFGGKTWLFEHDGRQYNPNSITSRIKAAGQAALGRNISAHTLRHSWTTEQLGKGRSLEKTSKYLGHSSIATTADIYGHTALDSDEAMLHVDIETPDPKEEAEVAEALGRALKDIRG